MKRTSKETNQISSRPKQIAGRSTSATSSSSSSNNSNSFLSTTLHNNQLRRQVRSFIESLSRSLPGSIVVFFVQLYINILLFFPRLAWRLGIEWNPVVWLLQTMVSSVLPNAADSHASDTIQGAPQLLEEKAENGYGEGLRWLEPGEFEGRHVVVASYPRSGNSLMRSLLEQITGIYTGSDTRPDRSLSKALKEMGMEGEGVVDSSVWFIKSHYPERLGWKPFKASKCILVVRNPYDAIDSYFNMIMTKTHHKSIHESQYQRFAETWDQLIKNEVAIWKQFHKFWLAQPIPVIVIRYEDLLAHRSEMMKRVFKFLLDIETLENSPWEAKIDEVCEESSAQRPYKPRSGKIGGSFKHYSKEQFQYVREAAAAQMRGFGYDPETQGFPERIEVPKKNIKPGKDVEVLINRGKIIRSDDDRFGRLFTRFRKSLTQPVLDNNGNPLNCEEVEMALQATSAISQANDDGDS